MKKLARKIMGGSYAHVGLLAVDGYRCVYIESVLTSETKVSIS